MKAPLATLAVLLASVGAGAATLTITPDRGTYLIGETIVLRVLGDPEAELDNVIVGEILYDSSLASLGSSSQETLTFLGGLPWTQGPLPSGDGSAFAFQQFGPDSSPPVDGPLVASVILVAEATGVLTYDWNNNLDFFGLDSAPGGSVLIIPEPGTAILLAVALLPTLVARRRRSLSLKSLSRAAISLVWLS